LPIEFRTSRLLGIAAEAASIEHFLCVSKYMDAVAQRHVDTQNIE
jgi:hypothetical protein